MRVIAGIVTVTMLLSGCGSEKQKEANTRTVTAAAERTDSDGPVAVREAVLLHAGVNEDVNVNAVGASDATRNLSRYAMHAKTNTTPAPPDVAKQLALLNGDVAQQGETVYLRNPAVNREFRRPGAWIRMDPNDPIARSVGFNGASSLGTVDPARPVDHLRAADDVEKIGNDSVGSHYRMVIDYDRYLDLLDPQRGASIRPTLEKIKGVAHTARQPLDAWIDVHGRIVRVEGKLRVKDGPDLVTYRLDLSRSPSLPAIPRHAVRLQDLVKK